MQGLWKLGVNSRNWTQTWYASYNVETARAWAGCGCGWMAAIKGIEGIGYVRCREYKVVVDESRKDAETRRAEVLQNETSRQ